MTTTPPVYPIVTGGIEYSVTPLQPPPDDYLEDPTYIPTWKSVTFNDLPNPIVLNGFRVSMRYFVSTCNLGPNGMEVCTKTYPEWELVSQTFEKVAPSRQVFGTDDGTELFVADPGTYTGYATAGITDGTTYEYVRVFDKADISYWPRASTPNQQLIENPTTLPSGNEQYLIDTLTSFVPDSRESVTITYQLSTTYRTTPLFGDTVTQTGTFTFTQDVLQNTDDVGDKIEGYLKRSYYADGKYHIQLHEMDEPDLYDAGGELIAPDRFKVPVYQETSEGYQKLLNSVTPITIDDILKETLDTSVEELENLIDIMDTYEYPE